MFQVVGYSASCCGQSLRAGTIDQALLLGRGTHGGRREWYNKAIYDISHSLTPSYTFLTSFVTSFDMLIVALMSVYVQRMPRLT